MIRVVSSIILDVLLRKAPAIVKLNCPKLAVAHEQVGGSSSSRPVFVCSSVGRRYLLSSRLQRPLWILQRSVQKSQGESKQLCKPKFSSVTSTTSCILTAGVSQVVTVDDKRIVTVVAPTFAISRQKYVAM